MTSLPSDQPYNVRTYAPPCKQFEMRHSNLLLQIRFFSAGKCMANCVLLGSSSSTEWSTPLFFLALVSRLYAQLRKHPWQWVLPSVGISSCSHARERHSIMMRKSLVDVSNASTCRLQRSFFFKKLDGTFICFYRSKRIQIWINKSTRKIMFPQG